MIKRAIHLVSAAFLMGVVLIAQGASPAVAGSGPPPALLGDIEPDETLIGYTSAPVVGVYELEHIAESPWLVFISSRTVSAVTRYWGTPPASTGLELHGTEFGILVQISCGNQAGHKDLIGYNGVSGSNADHPEAKRHLPFINVGSDSEYFVRAPLTAEQEAQLTVDFGAPVVLGISFGDHVGAVLLAWRFHIALAIVILGLGTFVVLHRKRRPDQHEAVT